MASTPCLGTAMRRQDDHPPVGRNILGGPGMDATVQVEVTADGDNDEKYDNVPQSTTMGNPAMADE